MPENKIDFSQIDWETSPLGSRVKAFSQNHKQARIVEIVRADEEADWCQNGHIGYIIEGELEIEFKGKTVKYSKGDGIIIEAGENEEHKPRAISEKVLLFLVEDI